MSWFLNFLLVLVIEYAQNIPIIIGIFSGLSGIKHGQPWWKIFLLFVGGSFVSAAVITATDWVKVMDTTRTTALSFIGVALRTGISKDNLLTLALCYTLSYDNTPRTIFHF